MEWGIDWLMTTPALTILFLLVVVDVIFGTAVAYSKNEVSSSASYLGVMKKMSMFVAVGLGFAFEILYINYTDLIPMQMPKRVPVAVLIALGFCWREMISIAEKIKRSGIWMPSWFSAMLDKLSVASGVGPSVSKGITLPDVKLGHVDVHAVKVDSDHAPVDPQVAKVAERRAARTASVLEEVAETSRENSTILKALAADKTNKPTNEDTET